MDAHESNAIAVRGKEKVYKNVHKILEKSVI
jgi:hypothetical protein